MRKEREDKFEYTTVLVRVKRSSSIYIKNNATLSLKDKVAYLLYMVLLLCQSIQPSIPYLLHDLFHSTAPRG